MAHEDKGLVLRGLLLLGAIGTLVAGVLAIMFWRNPTEPLPVVAPPEHHIPAVVLPTVGGFPSSVSWYSIYKVAETSPSAPGWDIRYGAATTLLRRGSDAVPWPLIREMLNEEQQMRNNRVRLNDGRDVHDEAAARGIMVSAMRALAVWHEKRKMEKKHDVPSELREIYTVVDKLMDSPIDELKKQAETARGTFFR